MDKDYLGTALPTNIDKIFNQTSLINIGNKRDYIVIVHGLGLSKIFLSKIVNFLNRKGYVVIRFNYPTRKYPIDVLSNEFLEKFVKYYCTDKRKKINFITHGSGGIIVRRYLENYQSSRTGRVVMIAPPNNGSNIVDYLKSFSLIKFIWWPILAQLGASKDSYVNLLKKRINYELGVLAGDVSLNPLSYLLLKSPNDGFVTVKSTKIKGMKDHIIISSSNLFLLHNPIALYQIISFLETGKFKH